MSSSSYTILPYSLPYTQEVQDALNMENAFLTQSNNFSVPQNFAGIVNSGSDSCASLAVSGNATIVGSLNAGPSTVSSLAVTNASVFNGQISGTSASMSGLISGANGLTINSGAVSFPVQSQSGASVINNTLPALSIVDKSIGDAQIALAGISQSSVLNGYMDLSTDQYIIGNKEFAGATRFLSGITNLGASALEQVQCTQLYAADINVNNNVSALTFTGDLNGNASTCSIATNIIVRTDNTAGSFAIPFIKTSDGNDSIYVDDAATPFMTYRPSDGLFSTANLTISTVATLSQVVLPIAQTVLATISGLVAVNLSNYSFNEFSLPMTANITSFTFSNVIVNSSFNIYLVNSSPANKTISKALSSGTIASINTLGGNTSVAVNAVYLIRGKVLSPTLVLLQFISAS